MVAISFSEKRFVELIRQGKKDQTIRPYNEKRFEQIKRIKKLQLYYKQRTKECFKIADAELTEIFKIKLFKDFLHGRELYCLSIQKWNKEKQCYEQTTIEEEIEIAYRDGFSTLKEMKGFFIKIYGENVYDMEFMIIRWRLIKNEKYISNGKENEYRD